MQICIQSRFFESGESFFIDINEHSRRRQKSIEFNYDDGGRTVGWVGWEGRSAGERAGGSGGSRFSSCGIWGTKGYVEALWKPIPIMGHRMKRGPEGVTLGQFKKNTVDSTWWILAIFSGYIVWLKIYFLGVNGYFFFFKPYKNNQNEICFQVLHTLVK